jgi:hypothetical protein
VVGAGHGAVPHYDMFARWGDVPALPQQLVLFVSWSSGPAALAASLSVDRSLLSDLRRHINGMKKRANSQANPLRTRAILNPLRRDKD